MAFSSKDIGVVLTFKVTENGGPVDLSGAASITLLVEGTGIALLCTIPSTPTSSPTYTTTGREGFPLGTSNAQLRIVFDASRAYTTSNFVMDIQ